MFKELNPLLHSELRLAVMSILIGVESADFVFIRSRPEPRRQPFGTAGQAGESELHRNRKDLPGQDALHRRRITDTGRDAFAEYVAALQTYIRK